MKSIIVLAPKIVSNSAKNLANALDCKYENPYDTGERNFLNYDFVFKYGFSRPIKAHKVFNKTDVTNISCDKIKVLQLFQQEPFALEFTKQYETAKKWINQGVCVVARAIKDGHNSEGVTLCYTHKHLEDAPAIFWTKYKKHTDEFRVNIWKGEVVSIYQKPEKRGQFNFILWQGQEKHPQLVNIAQTIYNKIGIDWCGIDILRDKEGCLSLLEINSAPILFPFTLKKLVERINKERK